MLSLRAAADRHPVIAYNLARLLLLVATFVVLALLGLRGLSLIASAFLFSGAISLVLLNGLRNTFSGVLSRQFQRINERIDAATTAEDDDEPLADQPQPDPQPQTGEEQAGGSRAQHRD